jgi:hypothetical protein
MAIKRKVFYSFYFDDDVFRVQQIRNMGLVEGDEPVSPNTWEQLQRTPGGVKCWIDDNIAGKSCLVVLIGTNTYTRPWVKYEIKKAWEDGKGLFGIHIHNLKCPKKGTSAKGPNPFDGTVFRRNNQIVVPRVYDPNPSDAYGDINRNLASWVETAVSG